MRVCGVEFKANTMIVSIVEVQNNEIKYIDTKEKKIILDNDEDKNSIVDFSNKIHNILESYSIDKMVVKKRAKKGNFSGGAITFKMEAILQLNSRCDVIFVSGQAISKYQKHNEIIIPCVLNKYQEQSYLSVLTAFANQ